MIAVTSKDGWRVTLPRFNRSILSSNSSHARTVPRIESLDSEVRQLEQRAEQLLEHHPHFRGKQRWVSCRYVDQSLRLVGCVPTFYLKQLAQESLRELKDIRIDNQLVVKCPGGVSEDTQDLN
jgi:hypothetical protein